MPPPGRREAGLRLILAYKAAKGVLWLGLAAGLALLGVARPDGPLRALAHGAHLHLVSHLSLEAARSVEAALSAHGRLVVALGLLLDGLVSLVEAWALRRGHRWGHWLVAATTALPIPWELVALPHHHGPVRLALLLANLVVVAFLLWRVPSAHA